LSKLATAGRAQYLDPVADNLGFDMYMPAGTHDTRAGAVKAVLDRAA
jgi:hypothetical protein